jgi:hypothetical protein
MKGRRVSDSTKLCATTSPLATCHSSLLSRLAIAVGGGQMYVVGRAGVDNGNSCSNPILRVANVIDSFHLED